MDRQLQEGGAGHAIEDGKPANNTWAGEPEGAHVTACLADAPSRDEPRLAVHHAGIRVPRRREVWGTGGPVIVGPVIGCKKWQLR